MIHERGTPDSLIVRGDVRFHETARVWSEFEACSFVALPGARITVGAHTFVNRGVGVVAEQAVDIGAGVCIGLRTLIYDSDHHALEGWHYPPGVIEPVRICDHVWIAMGAIILKGVTVGEGAVVAAGAVVHSDVAPWTLVAGSPARFVRFIAKPKTPHPLGLSRSTQ